MLELLAPAGSFESLRAAVQNGADAVYLGGTSFSARARAQNFDDIRSAVEYAHVRSTDVHFTLNTLVLDRETDAFLEEAKKAALAGVDAFIVQDLGAIELLRQVFPDIPIHASTQLSITNSQAAQACLDLGCSRLVLARELPADAIREIYEKTGAELEVFAHGAVCISYSGKCLMSSLIGGRSANRGQCAQPCRTCWEEGGRKGYLLNTKDLCLAGSIGALRSAGVKSIKLEGRMKGPLYVAAAVRAYREAIDTGRASDEARRALELTFMRGSFTEGRFAGSRSRFFTQQPGHTGQLAGTVRSAGKDYIELGGGAALAEGDEIVPAGADEDARKVRSVQQRGSVRRVCLRSARGFVPGGKVYKVTDAVLTRRLTDSCSEGHRKTVLSAKVFLEEGRPSRLSGNLPNGETFVVTGEAPERAVRRALTKEDVLAQLTKTGDAPFRFGSLEILLGEECALAKRALNGLRRDAFREAERLLACRYPDRRIEAPLPLTGKRTAHVPSHLLMLCATAEQAQACAPYASVLCLPASAWAARPEGPEVCGLVPGEASERELSALLEVYGKGTKLFTDGLLRDCLGAVAGPGLNTVNSRTLQVLRSLGFRDVVLSEELNAAQISSLLIPDGLTTWCMAYGYQQVMVTEHCPVDCGAEGRCRVLEEPVFLTDRTGRKMRVMKAGPGCRVRILNSVPLYGADMLGELRCGGLVLRFTVETPAECTKTARSFFDAVHCGSIPAPEGAFTRGHLARGVQ